MPIVQKNRVTLQIRGARVFADSIPISRPLVRHTSVLCKGKAGDSDVMDQIPRFASHNVLLTIIPIMRSFS